MSRELKISLYRQRSTLAREHLDNDVNYRGDPVDETRRYAQWLSKSSSLSERILEVDAEIRRLETEPGDRTVNWLSLSLHSLAKVYTDASF
jgi:hypothetical protein